MRDTFSKEKNQFFINKQFCETVQNFLYIFCTYVHKHRYFDIQDEMFRKKDCILKAKLIQ